jgi:hypothetical protein
LFGAPEEPIERDGSLRCGRLVAGPVRPRREEQGMAGEVLHLLDRHADLVHERAHETSAAAHEVTLA